MLLLRRLFSGFVAMSAIACTPPAPGSADRTADAAGPVEVVRALYAPYLAGQAVTPPAWDDAAPLTSELRTLLDQAATANDGQTIVDADPIIAAQDHQLSGVEVTADTPPANGQARVTARFGNMGKATIVHYDLVEADGGWRIDNIRSDPSFDLRQEIAAAIGSEHVPN